MNIERIVTHNGVFCQGDEGVEMWRYGVKIHSGAVHFVPSAVGRKSRGGIASFSYAARRRLREAMLTLDLSVTSYRFGLTLTLPWKVSEWGEHELTAFRLSFNRFTVAFKRAHPRWAAIFRVELQRRGAPHVHAIVYLPQDEYNPFDAWWVSVRQQIWALWFKALKNDLKGGSMLGFYFHGVRCDPIRTQGAMMRYLADHTSKGKQAQLGYTGKQWGFIARKNLKAAAPLVTDERLAGRALQLFNRALRKLCRYRVRARCAFGSRLSPGRVVRGGVRYLGIGTARRLADWAVAQAGVDDEPKL